MGGWLCTCVVAAKHNWLLQETTAAVATAETPSPLRQLQGLVDARCCYMGALPLDGRGPYCGGSARSKEKEDRIPSGQFNK
jgi:hypothetical protein